MRKGSKRKKKGLFILRRKGAKLCIGFVLLYSLWVIGVYSRMKINNDARIKDEVKMMKSTNAKKMHPACHESRAELSGKMSDVVCA